MKKPEEFRYIGKGVPSYDLKDMCTGHAAYGFDAQVPGMVYASIERAPVLGGTLKSFDDSQTKTVRGVRQTVVIEPPKPPYGFQALGGVAVIADNTWAAAQGRKKLKVEWNSGPNAIFQSESYKRDLIATASKPQKVVRKTGDFESGLKNAAKTLEATYYTPLLAHAPMEPPAALAVWQDSKVEVWAPTQSPQNVQKTVAQAVGIKPEDVICHVTLLLGEITASDGRIEQSNFNNYLVTRMNEAPLETHVHFVTHDEALPTGTGEPGVPPMSPALYNAVFAATGKRLRELPLRKQKLV